MVDYLGNHRSDGPNHYRAVLMDEKELKEFLRPAFKPPDRDRLCEFNGVVMTMGEWWDNHAPEETKRELLKKRDQ